ncbi:MAG: flap endonuclease-1 [Candidatus Woesearchaeota archaeon]
MGVALTSLLEGDAVVIESLKNSVVAIDAFNIIYQFLTVMRGPDGQPLTNSKGEVTAHLKGLLTRNIQFLKEGLKPIYVFDGKAPDLKLAERERRKELRDESQRKYDIAKERNDFEQMRKYAQRLVRIDENIIASSKQLLDYLGIPWVQAPSEGEAQAAFMVQQGDADLVVSQDADALLFKTPFLLRNLTIAGKKKKKGKVGFEKVLPVKYSLSKTLNVLGIDHDQLIVLAILVGTDFNYGGINGLGPKKALKLVQTYGKDFEKIFAEVSWNEHFEVSWKAIFDFFKNPPVTKDYTITFKDIQKEQLLHWLKESYDFSEDGLQQAIKSLDSITENQKQKGLADFW